MIPTGAMRPLQERNHPSWLEALLEKHPGDAQRDMESFLLGGGRGSLMLFGAGYQGELTLSDLRAMGHGDLVRGFLDNQESKWGQRVQGIPVHSPAGLEDLPRDTRILITSAHYVSIREQLRGLGFEENVRILDVSALRNGLFRRETLAAAKAPLERLHASLQDERSKRVLEGVVAYRLTGEIPHVERVCEPLQYFPEHLVRLGREEVFIDGGAFDGDTVRTFLAACHGEFQAVHAFEPDPRNFEKLRLWAQDQPLKERIHAHALGLYSHKAELCFNEGPSMSSRIEDGGGTRIQAVSLDGFLQGGPATFIKYDLEGAEREALLGAAATIRRWQPKLAISVYHLADDLWNLPQIIADLTPGYRYALGHYSFLSFETVFYAIPPGACP